MRYMVRRYGIRDAKGRRSFRHTIRGKSDLFRVVNDAGQVVVRPVVSGSDKSPPNGISRCPLK